MPDAWLKYVGERLQNAARAWSEMGTRPGWEVEAWLGSGAETKSQLGKYTFAQRQRGGVELEIKELEGGGRSKLCERLQRQGGLLKKGVKGRVRKKLRKYTVGNSF